MFLLFYNFEIIENCKNDADDNVKVNETADDAEEPADKRNTGKKTDDDTADNAGNDVDNDIDDELGHVIDTERKREEFFQSIHLYFTSFFKFC